MMSFCNEVDTLVQTYLDGELAPGDSAEFERHCASCSSCGVFLEEERRFYQFVSAHLAVPKVPEDLYSKIHGSLNEVDRAEKAESRRGSWQWAFPGFSAAIAVAALTLFTVSTVKQPGRTQNSGMATAAIKEQATIPVSMLRRGTRPELSRAAQQYVRMPVRPPRFNQSAAPSAKPNEDLRGYLQSQLNGRVAALFVYEISTNYGLKRVFVHTLDARNVDLKTDDKRMIGDKELWLTQKQGFSTVAYTDETGVGYVFSSKMDGQNLVGLVAKSDLINLVESQQNSK